MTPEPRDRPFPLFSTFLLVLALFILGSFAAVLVAVP